MLPLVIASSNFPGVGPEAERVLRELRAREANNAEGKQLFWREYNAALMKKVESLSGRFFLLCSLFIPLLLDNFPSPSSGVAGMHVMPVTARGWKELPHLCKSFGRYNMGKQSS